MNRPTFLYWLCIAGSLLVLLSACQPSPGATDATDVNVETGLPVRAIIATEEIPIPNCEGNLDMIQTLGSIKNIELKSQVDTTAVGTDGSEQKLSESLMLQLEIEVKNAYEQTYQSAIEGLEKVSMDAAWGFETVYVIQWEQRRYGGNVYYSDGNRVYKVHYLYQLTVPRRLSREERRCEVKVEGATLSPQPESGLKATSAFTPLAPTEFILVLRTNTYLYKGPQIEYGTVDLRKRKKGQDFSVVAQNPDGDWFLVQESDGTQGWLYIMWVNMTFDVELIPISTEFPPPPPRNPTPTRRPKPPTTYP